MVDSDNTTGGDFKRDTVRIVLKEEDLIKLMSGKVATTTGMFQSQERHVEIILSDIGIHRIIDLLSTNANKS